jgi:hypothetical protein
MTNKYKDDKYLFKYHGYGWQVEHGIAYRNRFVGYAKCGRLKRKKLFVKYWYHDGSHEKIYKKNISKYPLEDIISYLQERANEVKATTDT